MLNLMLNVEGSDWSLEGNGALVENAYVFAVDGNTKHGYGDFFMRTATADKFTLSVNEYGQRWYTGLAKLWLLKPGIVQPGNFNPNVADCDFVDYDADCGFRVNESLPFGVTDPADVPPGQTGGYMVEFFANAHDEVGARDWRFAGLRLRNFPSKPNIEDGAGLLRIYGIAS